MKNLLKQNAHLITGLVFMMGFYAACTESTSPATHTIKFKLYILDIDVDQLVLESNRERPWPVFKETDLEKSIWIITENEIESYDWSQQSITLTAKASVRLQEIFSEELSLTFGLAEQAFVVTLGEEILYGGIFMEEGVARGVRYPVIYPEETGNRIIFFLRPISINLANYQDFEPDLRHTLEFQNVYDFFLEQGKLVE
jgi:hypothetical protein